MADPVSDPDESAQPSGKEAVYARRALIAVGVAYLVAQLLLFSYHRKPLWDESVYISQVMRGVTARPFSVYRARGITFLIAPVALLGGSLATIRLYLEAVSSIALVAVFWLWIPIVRMAAPIAALIFGSSWLALVAGSEVMPNLWAALLGLATAAFVVRRISTGANRYARWAAATLALMALFRPTEAALLAGALTVFILVFHRKSWRVLIPVAIGLFLGWLPWIIEMSVRFGGPLNALRQAANSHYGTVHLGRQVTAYLGEIGGRGIIRVPAVLAWSWLLVLIVAAFLLAKSTRKAMALCCIAALLVAVEYMAFVSAFAPRFMLPFYAMVSIPAACGVVSLLRGTTVHRFLGAILLTWVIPWAIWQGTIANRVEAKMLLGNDAQTAATSGLADNHGAVPTVTFGER